MVALRAKLSAAPRCEALHERLAFPQLLHRDELVGLVGLFDGAGSAHDRRNADGLEVPRFRAIGNGVRGIGVGTVKSQDFRR